jgi:hypothetical protein
MESNAQNQNKSQCSQQGMNVADAERMASVAAGTVLTLWGIPRLTRARGLIALALGASLLKRGVTGHCALYHSLGVNRESAWGHQGQGSRVDSEHCPSEPWDRVEEAGLESFPASDSPSWSGTSGVPGGSVPRFRSH